MLKNRLRDWIAQLTQWVLRWADPSLIAAPLIFERDTARAEVLRLDKAFTRLSSDYAAERDHAERLHLNALTREQSARESERLGRVIAESSLARMQIDEAARLADDVRAQRQAEQRAADLESYRAYLYDLMPNVCQRAGLDPSLIAPSWNVPSTGKLNDVIHHLSLLDHRGHALNTLDDVIALFVGRA